MTIRVLVADDQAVVRQGVALLLSRRVSPCSAVDRRSGVHGRMADGRRGVRAVGEHRRLSTDGHGRGQPVPCLPAQPKRSATRQRIPNVGAHFYDSSSWEW